jgi:hypothetical protein
MVWRRVALRPWVSLPAREATFDCGLKYGGAPLRGLESQHSGFPYRVSQV